MIKRLFFPCLVAGLGCLPSTSRADDYDNIRIECGYVTQCSMSKANPTVGALSGKQPGYGALNDWRIGNGKADFVDCGTQGIGAIGLLYGYARLKRAGRSTTVLDTAVRIAAPAFFNFWLLNPANHVSGAAGSIGFPATAAYNSDGTQSAQGAGSAAVTAQLLIAMRKYCQLSPNGDRTAYQTRQYSLAHHMADYIDMNLSSWTVDESYAVAAFRCLSNWATAMKDATTATHFASRASSISAQIYLQRSPSPWYTYYDYVDGGGKGVFSGSNIDQTGFSPYEFNARPASEAYAALVGKWWDYGTGFQATHLTVQSGPYAGGVHQSVPSLSTRAYPGDSFQLADAEWKIATADHNLNNQLAQAQWHYNFALSPLGSAAGSGCWVNNTSVDGFVGGFVDWVDTTGQRPPSWQRFIDTSGYMLVATEELKFNNQVDWSL